MIVMERSMLVGPVQAGASLEYNHEGQLVKSTPVARAPGTTVALRHLFANLPVRHKVR